MMYYIEQFVRNSIIGAYVRYVQLVNIVDTLECANRYHVL